MAFPNNLAIVLYQPDVESPALVDRFFNLIRTTASAVAEYFDSFVKVVTRISLFSATVATVIATPTKVFVCPYVSKFARKVVC